MSWRVDCIPSFRNQWMDEERMRYGEWFPLLVSGWTSSHTNILHQSPLRFREQLANSGHRAMCMESEFVWDVNDEVNTGNEVLFGRVFAGWLLFVWCKQNKWCVAVGSWSTSNNSYLSGCSVGRRISAVCCWMATSFMPTQTTPVSWRSTLLRLPQPKFQRTSRFVAVCSIMWLSLDARHFPLPSSRQHLSNDD